MQVEAILPRHGNELELSGRFPALAPPVTNPSNTVANPSFAQDNSMLKPRFHMQLRYLLLGMRFAYPYMKRVFFARQ